MSETQLSDQYLYQSSLKSDPDIKVSSGKRVPFVIDLNQGSYQNGVITIDATSQLNGSEGFASLRDAYIMLPYKTIVSMADYKLFWSSIRAQTGYSPPYVEKHGAESFLFPDAAQSSRYSATGSFTGDGYSNNTAFSSSFTAGAISATASVANDGFLGRGAFVAGGYAAGAIMGTWNFMLKIKLVDLHPIFKELDLMANPQIRLRFRVNQGTVAIDADTSRYMTLTSTTLSSGNTCPVMIASSASSNPMVSVLSGSTAGSTAVSWGAVNPQAIISKPVKKVRYNDRYAQWFYQRAGIGKQGTQLNASFDLQLSASVKNANFRVRLIRFLGHFSLVRAFATSMSVSVRLNASTLVMTTISTNSQTSSLKLLRLMVI
ncbi:uncharacterized protein PITG_05033 [Phytophthora infestans T30-4]|uniref:Uncharacterized protein n=1 Tax=Phytophthora infestans (strain T30-4) TaxID=403677 RepID=D0N2M0_PHYIT|nr:uncharacterized protein PITG_14331 [Phytophthora infestans T30-4]XP_002905708.1 uncharacterized protein PITG_05033 [Phytophthora infestans T30-4]EEY62572.1 conserved hypothetical protein [Phytophthora infestans T30-4]EEY68549.1 conserved hypothetical protein [Phytophthora infestans T30-4]|eukprot:XP_002898814.1 conserved hypothetical protein [Phytophthora infestans T30-4]